jgi:hypothetical protein
LNKTFFNTNETIRNSPVGLYRVGKMKIGRIADDILKLSESSTIPLY